MLYTRKQHINLRPEILHIVHNELSYSYLCVSIPLSLFTLQLDCCSNSMQLMQYFASLYRIKCIHLQENTPSENKMTSYLGEIR